jgi:hypothetical protein
MNNIQELQYISLRENLNKNLINPILGEGYYNMGMDVYTCDQFTTEDLKREFDKREKELKVYKTLFYFFLLNSVVLTVTVIMNKLK